ncbi:hypothetical protein HID58_089733 [Brassica napus]|uniref:Sulfotransferase n=1 Tax=Brassica napus TaxID=3708 RepID=A0ABQ7XZV3_BRANA|nr:hypothetical protein HID58_089733 [Brassica napus]
MNVRDDNVSEETKKLISSLPTDEDSLVKLCKYQGCWYYYNTLQAVINFQNNFQPQDTDIISGPVDNLSGLEVNRTGKTLTNVDHNSLFRKGEVGGWKNYLTPEMENKIDMIIDEELKGSGLTF